MPPNQSANPRGRPRGSTNKPKPNALSKTQGPATTSARRRRRSSEGSEDPFADSQPDLEESVNVEDDSGEQAQGTEGQEEEEEEQKIIPPELLTRILHEFFEKEGTRISKDANKAVGKYMDVFVREAIARAAVEKESGFLEVEDLEKVAPQLLLDL